MYFPVSLERLIVFKIRLVSITFLPVHKQKYGIFLGTNLLIISIRIYVIIIYEDRGVVWIVMTKRI